MLYNLSKCELCGREAREPNGLRAHIAEAPKLARLGIVQRGDEPPPELYHSEEHGVAVCSGCPGPKVMEADKLRAQLAHYHGTNEYHRMTHSPSFLATDGVRFLADEAGAHWLVTAVGSYQGHGWAERAPFQVWRLRLDDEGPGAVLEAGDDTTEDGTELVHYSRGAGSRVEVSGPAIRQVIPYTDFPLPEIKLIVEDSFTYRVLMLPSER